MARIETWFNQDLKQAVKVQYLDGNVFSADNAGNVVGVNVFDDGQPATLGGSVSGSIIRADGVTVAVVGTLSGNQASIVLPQDAYIVPGVVSIVIKLTSGTDITTLCAVVSNVYMSSTDSVVDPGTIIPSIETLIAEIEAVVASIPADYSSLWACIAPVFNSSTYYFPGQYVTYDENVYACKVNHYGTWDSSHFTSTSIGSGLGDVVREYNSETETAVSVSETGKYLLQKGNFDVNVYNPSTGYVNQYENRISARRPIIFPFYATLVIGIGFRLYPYFQSGGSWAGDGWKTGNFNISANTPFYCQIARSTEVTEVADVPTFLNAVEVKGGYADIRDTEINGITESLTYAFRNWEIGGWSATQGSTPVKEPLTGYRIRSRNLIEVPKHILVNIKQSGVRVVIFYADADGKYLGTNANDSSVGYYDHYTANNPNAKNIFLSAIFTDGIPENLDDYFAVEFKNNTGFADGKNVFVYHYGGSGNDWCFVRTPSGYDSARNKPYPFVICNHGNGWTMDGSIEKANWTKRTMYVPLDDPDYIANPTQYNGTADESLWYSNPTIEALLDAGYIVCGCENYGDELYGNNNCRNACVDFFNHMINTYNVEKRCYMIGASNGAMTSLNAAYLLQGNVKAMILQYPLTCLVNQYQQNTNQRPGIRAAYGITDPDITIEELAKAVATHDPLTTDVVDGIKVGVFPPVKLYYSPGDTVVKYQYNSIALAEMLENSNKVVETVQCSGEHGDYSHFAPADYVAWFNAN